MVEDRCPACDKPDCIGECPEMDEAMCPDFITHIDSYTGHPHYTVNSARAKELFDRCRCYDLSSRDPCPVHHR